MAAVICMASPLVIPVGPVPVSLSMLAVEIAGIVLGPFEGTLAVAVYILIGACGVPVFSGFTGGIQHLVGVTGGYFAGYLICAFVVGLGARRRKGKMIFPAVVLGTLLCYACGTVWFMICTGSTFQRALVGCVAPFVPGDVLKALAAVTAGKALQRRLRA